MGGEFFLSLILSWPRKNGKKVSMCVSMFEPRSISPGDWDLFPLEWVRAETGGDDQGVS